MTQINNPVRVQRKRTKGWRMPPNTVSVTRPSIFGNPYRVGIDGDALGCVNLFRVMLDGNVWSEPNERSVRKLLRGKNLACYCPLGQPCHADVLLEIANG